MRLALLKLDLRRLSLCSTDKPTPLPSCVVLKSSDCSVPLGEVNPCRGSGRNVGMNMQRRRRDWELELWISHPQPRLSLGTGLGWN